MQKPVGPISKLLPFLTLCPCCFFVLFCVFFSNKYLGMTYVSGTGPGDAAVSPHLREYTLQWLKTGNDSQANIHRMLVNLYTHFLSTKKKNKAK